MEIKEPFRNDRPKKVLRSGTVKELEQKIRNFEVGKPSIFMGSSRESLFIAEKVKGLFEAQLFEVDIWDEGVFGKTFSSNDKNSEDTVLSNVEWLKNFTDIYDYSIFLFVPEDKIVSETRILKSEKGEEVVPATLGTRHNVVFEFGMFLGRIGAKKSFVLFDKRASDFVKLFFTDLAENLMDPFNTGFVEPENNFISLYPFECDDDISDKDNLPVLDKSLGVAVERIKKQILLNIESIDITFLPSTTLALGYFNNFVEAFVKFVNALDASKVFEQNDMQKLAVEINSKVNEDAILKETIDLIRSKKKIVLKIVIPNSLDGAVQDHFKPMFNKSKFRQRSILGPYRPLPVGSYISSESKDEDTLVFYDVPTTMNSSIEALSIINPHDDIKELLSEKERQNFKKVFDYKLRQLEKVFSNVRQNVEIISWTSFLQETNQG